MVQMAEIRRAFKRVIAVTAAFLLGCTALQPSGFTALAASSSLKDKFSENGESISFTYNPEMYTTYTDIQKEYAEKGYSAATQEVSPLSSIPEVDGEPAPMRQNVYGYAEPAFVWENKEEKAVWTFEVPADGLYEMQITYHLGEDGDEAVRSLTIDGESRFDEMSRIVFPAVWKSASEEKLYNALGDEIRQKQVFVPGWRTAALEDSSGFYSLPLQFYFTAGRHTLELSYISFALYIADIRLTVPRSIHSYADKQKEYQAAGYKPVSADMESKFQAEENVSGKSQASIRVDTDSSLTVEPQSLKYIRMNVMGAYTWRTGGQSISWTITVPESGLYTLWFRERQQWNEGLPSYRKIEIDGSVPFEEMLAYPFQFSRSWQSHTLADAEGTPYLFYLEKGKHTLTMTVKLGGLTEIIQEIYAESIRLSNLLTRIMMITSDEPDANYDYDLDTRIPELLGTLEEMAAHLDDLSRRADKLSGQHTSFAGALESCADSLFKLLKKPDKIAINLSELETTQSTLTDWYANLQIQPLSLDYFCFGSMEKPAVAPKANIFQGIAAFFQNLYYSFIKDYDTVGGLGAEGENGSIDIWIGRSKEWAETLQRLIDDEFTPSTGIAVRMNIVPASQLGTGGANALMLAIVSGEAPDMVLATTTSSAVELAIRGAVADLSAMEGYEEFTRSFQPGILQPFQYGDGVYGLPETMDFNVLIYRKDILSALSLDIPQTWQEVLNRTLPVLYQNNMEMYIPVDFSPFLYQYGGDYYVNDGQYTGLSTDDAFRAFKFYCELFTNYDVPISANFYNRIRTGAMPIGIANYSLYLQLLVAAPELTGKWGIALTPGTRQGDGSIDRSYAGLSSDADIVLADTGKEEQCWSFLKWWLGTDTQVQYARDLEVTIGPSAKWNPANKDAYEYLSWDADDLEIIREMQGWGRDMPNVLGGYFTSRHISNAWNRTVLSGESPRDSLETAVFDINKELLAKQTEYGKTFDSE